MIIKALNENSQGVILNLKIIPNSKQFKFAGLNEWDNSLKLKIKNEAKEGKANKEIVEKLSEFFETKAKIITGHKSSKKKVLLFGLKQEQVENLLKL